MTKTWKCDVCGYIHRGDALPESCPVCGATPDLFSVFEAVAPATSATSRRWRCTVCDHVHVGGSPPAACTVCAAERSLFEPLPEVAPLVAVQADVGRILIVGAGIAGLTAAEQARVVSPDVAITVIGKESGLPYYRLNLTRYLAGEVNEESLAIQPSTWFAEHRIELLEGEVAAIDRVRQEVRLRDGTVMPYDRLVLANGAHPFVPPLPGVTRQGVLPLRTRVDALAIVKQATPGARCVCLGGGLLGLEAAGALQRRGASATVLEGFGWLLPRQLAEPAAARLQRHIEGLGVAVRCGVRVEEILGDERVRGVRLAGGEVIAADLLVLATGVRPNSYLARQSDLEVKGGVVVDDRLFTSDAAILAAGDVAEHRGVLYGIWPTAYAQGIVAGANAVGGALEFRGIAPSNRLKVLDVDLYSVGQFHPTDGSFQVIEEQTERTYLRLVCRDGKLIGAILYGDTQLAGLLKDAIEHGTQLAQSAEFLTRFPQLVQLGPRAG
jgi:nitrite reductase (NADH) large subunit